MSQAKDDRSGATVYARERDDRSRDRLVLVNDFRGAIGRGELIVQYQPKADMSTGAIRGVEALVHYDPLPPFTPAFSSGGRHAGAFPVAERLSRRALSLTQLI